MSVQIPFLKYGDNHDYRGSQNEKSVTTMVTDFSLYQPFAGFIGERTKKQTRETLVIKDFRVFITGNLSVNPHLMQVFLKKCIAALSS